MFHTSSVELMDSYEILAEYITDIPGTMESPTFPPAGVKVMGGSTATAGEFPYQVLYEYSKG